MGMDKRRVFTQGLGCKKILTPKRHKGILGGNGCAYISQNTSSWM